MRSLQLTSAHNMPMAPSPEGGGDSRPAADGTARRTGAEGRVGTSERTHTKIRREAGEVAQENKPTTAVTSPSAICPSRGARTLSFMPIDSGLRSDMV